MAQNKYIVFKNQDAQQFLNDQQKQQLLDILRTLAEGRRTSGKSVNDLFFVLNMKDQYAQRAIEAYIAAIHNDDTAENNAAVQAALDTAVTVRQTAMLNIDARLPD